MRYVLTLILFSLSLDVLAAFKRMPQDIVLPSQKMLEYMLIDNAVATSENNILNDATGSIALNTSATVTTFLAQPDFARNLVVTPMGVTNDVAAGNVVVSGFDIGGKVVTESFVFTANQTEAVTGLKAFARITSILFPAEDSPFQAGWDVGVGLRFGVKGCLNSTSFIIKTFIDSASEAIVATSSATMLSSNVFSPTNVPNGARDYEMLFIDNNRCK